MSFEKLKDVKASQVTKGLDFTTSTTIWSLEDTRAIRDWRKITGEDGSTGSRAGSFRKEETAYSGTYSIFPYQLAVWMLLRYAPPGSKVLDAFAGGPPRAVAASMEGYEYHGVDIRQEAIDENLTLLNKLNLAADYYLDDATLMKTVEDTDFDFSYTCPPYYDLEIYSNNPNDLSNSKNYQTFNEFMKQSIVNIYDRLKPGSFSCMVVGNFRDKKTSELIDFRGDTVNNHKSAGFIFWQDIVLAKSKGSAAVRAGNSWKGKKLVPQHEYLLVFKKPESRSGKSHTRKNSKINKSSNIK